MNKMPMKPAVLITDRDGRIKSADTIACKLFAGSGTTLTGQDFRRLPYAGLADLELSALAALPQSTVLPLACPNLPFDLMVSEIRMEPESFFVIFIYPSSDAEPDIAAGGERTDLLTQAVATLEQAKDEVQTSLLREIEVSRLKTRFISLASHEFRSPLSSIQLSAALIERYYDRLNRDKVFYHLNKIRLAIGDLTGILEDFLSLERIDTGKLDLHLEKIDVPSFCRELLLEMELQARADQRLVFEHQGGDPYFWLDRKLIRHCLVNLLSNAIKYSGENGVITLSSFISEAGCRIVLADDGLGIPAEDQPHIFESFFRASNVIDKQGTGLGLSIVQRYCGLMSGTVTFKSQEHQGSTFTLWVPVTSPPAFPG